MFWLPVAMALGSAALGWWNQEQLAKKQDQQAARTITNQAAEQRKADAKLADLVKNLGASNQEEERAQQQGRYLDTLRLGAASSGVQPVMGNVSDAYRAGTAAANEDVANFGADRAGLLARMDAPQLQRMNEGILFSNTGVDLDQIRRGASGQAYLDDLRLKSLRANPWVDALSQAGMAYAGGMAGGGGSAAGVDSGTMTGFGNNMDNFQRVGWGY